MSLKNSVNIKGLGKVNVDTKNISTIGLKEAHDMFMKGTKFIDVRRPNEFKDGHIPRAKLITLYQMESQLRKSGLPKDEMVIVYCRADHRSKDFSAMLEKKGYKYADMEGGFNEWKKAGYEVDTGDKGMMYGK